MKIRINVLDGFTNIVGSLIINLFTYSILIAQRLVAI